MEVPRFQAEEGEWDAAVRASAECLGARDPEATVFHESREDWRLVVQDGRPVERVRTRSSGVRFDSASPRRPSFWFAAPARDELTRLASLVEPRNPRWFDRNTAERAGGTEVEGLDPLEEVDGLASIPLGGGGTEVTLHAASFRQTVRVGTRGREVVREVRSGSWVRVVAVRRARGRSSSGIAERVLSSSGSEEIREAVREAEDRARIRMEARTLNAGTTDVVFGKGVGGVLIHELIGHALEGDAVAGRRSWLSSGGVQVGPPEMTVVDDPRRGRAAWRWDDEGVEARATVLVRRGRVVGSLLDRGSALRLGAQPTGHGRRATFRDPVLPRMGATFLAGGTSADEEPVAATSRGVFIRRMSAGRTHRAKGMAVFRVTDAEAIDKGRRTYPVHPFLLVVSVDRPPMDIDCIGKELGFDSNLGSCHRAGQTLSTSVGAPTFRLRSIAIARPGVEIE
jgi:hypothetical protein